MPIDLAKFEPQETEGLGEFNLAETKQFIYNRAADGRKRNMASHAKKMPKDATPDSLYQRLVGPVQFIPEELWADVSILRQPSLKNLHHPHFHLLFNMVLERYKPNSENIVICGCGSSKPYSKNSKYKFLLKLSKLGYFDIAICSTNFMPMYPLDTTTMYPNIFYDWPHECSDPLDIHYHEIATQRMIRFLTKFKYKRIIFVDSYKNQCSMDVVVDTMKDFNFVELAEYWPTPVMHKQLMDKFKNEGLWKTRFFLSKILRNNIAETFNIKNTEEFEW